MSMIRANTYKPPAVDSAQAVANAQRLLSSAVHLRNITAVSLAKQYRLSLKRAEYMLQVEQGRRQRAQSPG
ncbi:hypothetical protein BSL82_01205 [Tardibacter chloracetimidivorans]|uniref:Uncharacterized protein n=1 Tax=Tardibacter chloracetimidivorans TaxID=1921510 RepID=A0A1L3ZR28_9SPHN|nr:hypothetical protein [Tardibacter chloracetimidivorans]API58082.1 hypothetical protein BSL82_01205 [Tardibacter chloracetimidivorans]